jgi:hypothetical protein
MLIDFGITDSVERKGKCIGDISVDVMVVSIKMSDMDVSLQPSLPSLTPTTQVVGNYTLINN